MGGWQQQRLSKLGFGSAGQQQRLRGSEQESRNLEKCRLRVKVVGGLRTVRTMK